jgi:methionyl-tRNA formyltransferase
MNVALFINGNLGLRVLDYFLNSSQCNLSGVILNSDKKRSANYLTEVKSKLSAKNIDLPILKWDSKFSEIKELDAILNNSNFGVSALFGHLLPEDVISKLSGGILNLHPSLLPIGRGADPIPWGIIDGHKQGITLHLIDTRLDSGAVICQKEIPTDISMNAGEIYEIAMSEMFTEFSTVFPKWINGEIQGTPQSKVSMSLHKSRDLNLLRDIKDNEIGSFGEFIRRIQATSFSNGWLPRYIDKEGNIWEIETKIIKSPKKE